MKDNLRIGRVIAQAAFMLLVLVTIFSIPEVFLALPAAAQLSIAVIIWAIATIEFLAILADERDGRRR